MLPAYLAAEAAKPFAWGLNDCATLAIGWADKCQGLDGLARWRGWYASADQCEAFIAANGGFEAIATGFVRCVYDLAEAPPQPGNALVAKVNGVTMMGLRIDARLAAFRSEAHGLITTRYFEPLKEWIVPCRRS